MVKFIRKFKWKNINRNYSLGREAENELLSGFSFTEKKLAVILNVEKKTERRISQTEGKHTNLG